MPHSRLGEIARRAVGLCVLAALISGLVLIPRAAVADTARPYGRYGLPLAVDENSAAVQQLAAKQLSVRSPALRATRTIASYPTANWFGGTPAATTRQWVRSRVESAAARHSVAQLVVFNLPNRGCGPVPETGPTTAAGYRHWFRGFLQGLGEHRAIVIVEPDALGLASCLPIRLRLERYALIAWAVKQLHRQGSWAYIDVGHSSWLPERIAVNRLRASGIARAAGFSLNVSNFRPTPELVRYGTAISKRVGGRHFVIDSGRNGVTPRSDTWCNPPGAGLGHAPTAHTGIRRLDAFLWIKPPGDTDGACNSGPASGFWPAYAARLLRNAHLKG